MTPASALAAGVALAAAWTLAYHRAPARLWTAVIGAGLAFAMYYAGWTHAPFMALWIALWIVFAIGALLLNPTPLRRRLVSRPLLHLFRRILPAVSQTEKEALEAGTVWWDGELF